MKNLFKFHNSTIPQFHNSTILKGSIVLIMMTLFILSCQREDVRLKPTENFGIIENRTAEPCEPSNNGAPCQKQTWSTIRQIDMFPGCWFDVYFTLYNCEPNGIYYGTPTVSDRPQCPAYISWLNNCMTDPITFKDCMDWLNQEVIIAIGQHGWPGSITTINPHFVEAACHQYCVSSQFDPKGYYVTSISKLRCSDACCLKEFSFEWNPITLKWELIDCTSTRYNGIGCEYQQQVEVCEYEIYTSSCIDNCVCLN